MMDFLRYLWNQFEAAVPAQQLIMRSGHPDRVLVFARELIAHRARWTTGVEARRADGYICDPKSPKAARFCAAGAIEACATTDAARDLALALLADAIDPVAPAPGRPRIRDFMRAAGFSDHRGHRETLALFDRATGK